MDGKPDKKSDSVHDPLGLLDSIVPSKHCKGQMAKVIAYDHSGWTQAKCGCGEAYIHDRGPHPQPEFSTDQDD